MYVFLQTSKAFCNNYLLRKFRGLSIDNNKAVYKYELVITTFELRYM